MSITPIQEFHELHLPMEDGGRTGEWCTFDADANGMFYLLNKDRYQLCHLGDICGRTAVEIHFSTEADCHYAAAEYYTQHGIVYPYMTQWLAASLDVTIINDLSQNDEVISQRMKFT